MKKSLCLFFVLVFVVSLCACSNINHKKALIGTWEYNNYELSTYVRLTFQDDDTYSQTVYYMYSDKVKSSENGEYSIRGGRITMIDSYGKESALYYQYKNGKIVMDNGHKNDYTKIY